MGEAVADGRNFEVFFEGVDAVAVGEADADGGDVQADGDVGVGAGGSISWLYAEPGDGSGGELHEGMGLATRTGGTFAKYLYAGLEAGASVLLDDCSGLGGEAV